MKKVDYTLYFITNSDGYDEETFLNKVKARHIRIVGHTDSSGDKQKNKQLSLQRAEAVKHYLMSQNIAATRLSVEGWGDEKPIADNHTVDGRKKNRRIEFEVL